MAGELELRIDETIQKSLEMSTQNLQGVDWPLRTLFLWPFKTIQDPVWYTPGYLNQATHKISMFISAYGLGVIFIVVGVSFIWFV